MKFPFPNYLPEGVAAAAPSGDLNDPGGAPAAVVEEVEQQPVVEAPKPEPTIPLSVFKHRVDALTRQKAELEARLAAEPPAAPPPSPPQGRSNVQEEAQFLAAQMRLNEKSLEIASAGQALAPDFMLRVQHINSTLGVLPSTFIEALAEAGGDPATSAKLLYDLSGDLAKAGTILAMSPTKQAIALAKMAQEIEVSKTVPKGKTVQPVPDPITPKVGGGGRGVSAAAPDVYDEKVPVDDWMKQRDATARKRRR